MEDRHINMKPKNLKKGEFFGYYQQRIRIDDEGNEHLVYDDKGNPVPDYSAWVTGQNGPNELTSSERALIEKWNHDYASGPVNYWKAVSRDFADFFIDFGKFCVGRLGK